jgi:antirestriction protein ArdC
MNVYETVTERLIAALESGVIPWRKPWKASAESGAVPFNRASGKSYRGINIWLLECAPYSSRAWMTYKQAAELGAHVRKGEKGWPVVFWKFDRERVGDDGDKVSSVLMRQYTVFNADQIEGLPQSLPFELPAFNPIESAQAVIDKYLTSASGLSLAHGGDRAFYNPSSDHIQMPLQGTFLKPEGYYTTLFHEAGHSTGHASRCDRMKDWGKHFGDHLYSKEELVAEFTAAFLCAQCGISNEYTETNSAAYLQNWISAFKNDSRVAVSAAQRAQKACDFILNGAAVVTSEQSEEVAA